LEPGDAALALVRPLGIELVSLLHLRDAPVDDLVEELFVGNRKTHDRSRRGFRTFFCLR
jgi:hypothetical protein